MVDGHKIVLEKKWQRRQRDQKKKKKRPRRLQKKLTKNHRIKTKTLNKRTSAVG